RDRHDVIVQPECEQHLGGRGNEADNPHRRSFRRTQPRKDPREPTRHSGGGTMAQLLGEDDIASRLEDSEWRRESEEIVREWRFENFAAAMEFVNRVADAAEETNHHPDILIYGWNKVKLSLTNHPDGGLT